MVEFLDKVSRGLVGYDDETHLGEPQELGIQAS
jgi:hypothetical protein